MGVLGWVIGVGLAGLVIKGAQISAQERAEQERRRNTPCSFTEGISKEEFENIVRRASKQIKRITSLSINGPFINGSIRSQSGASEWSFGLDFNDYGWITGRHWIESDNEDSSIPKRLGELISSERKRKCL